MLKKIDLYIFKNFITRIVFLLIIISSIIILTNFVEMIDNFINAGMGSKEIFNYYIFTIPMFISYAIPMSVTIGTVLSIISNIKNNELIVVIFSFFKISIISFKIAASPILELFIIRGM